MILSGRDRYVVKSRDHAGRTRIRLYRDEKHKHGYTLRPEARNIRDFQQAIVKSFQPDANFLNSILITRYRADRFCTLHNLEYTEARGTKITVHQILHRNDLAKQVEDIFQIPASITAKVLDGLELTGDAWN